MMTEFNQSSEAAAVQPDPVGDAHGADPEADLFPAGPSEGSDIGVDPEADPHVGKGAAG